MSRPLRGASSSDVVAALAKAAAAIGEGVGELLLRVGGGSMSASIRGWREQYDRMLRWHARLREHADERRRLDEERQRDDYYAFFVFCYHLKDWLKNDPQVLASVGDAKTFGERVEAVITEKKSSLAICADLTNGVKHLIRDNPKQVRVDPDARLSAPPAAFQRGAFQADAFQVGEIVVKFADQRLRAEEVADRCVTVWQELLHREHLL